MHIYTGADHAGAILKNHLVEYLKTKGYQITDYGTNTTDSVDYPDYAHKVASSVEQNENTLGLLVCGSGNGVCMTANKHSGIRAALVWNTELAEVARSHNNANVLCLPARFISSSEAEQILEMFLKTAFEGGRHQNRVQKISL